MSVFVTMRQRRGYEVLPNNHKPCEPTPKYGGQQQKNVVNFDDDSIFTHRNSIRRDDARL